MHVILYHIFSIVTMITNIVNINITRIRLYYMGCPEVDHQAVECPMLDHQAEGPPHHELCHHALGGLELYCWVVGHLELDHQAAGWPKINH